MCSQLTSVRIDKWLWAARFFKSRQLAVKAIKLGRVTIGSNKSIKPSATVSIGAHIHIKRGAYTTTLVVTNLSEKRGPASIAATLYEETADSIAERIKLSEQLAQQPRIQLEKQKPDKRGVREQLAIKRGKFN